MSRQLNLDALSQSFSAIARQQRWTPLHSPKNLACAISVEAAELLVLFQWHSETETHPAAAAPPTAAVAAELADIVLYANALADQLGIDLAEAVMHKCHANNQRFGLRHDR